MDLVTELLHQQHFKLYLVRLGATPSGVQGLLLAVDSQTIPGGAQGTIKGARNRTQVGCTGTGAPIPESLR